MLLILIQNFFCKFIPKRYQFSTMKNIMYVCILLFFTFNLIHNQNYTLFLTSQQNGASCLDGSPHGLYIHEGNNGNRDNFIVYFQGGGYCGDGNLSSTLQSCYQRSNGQLGSSKPLALSRSFDQSGILSTNPQSNPLFYDWTKVIVNYCDGSEYFGNRPEPIPYKDKKLYFRGTNNVLQTIRYLELKYDIFRKQKIIVSGKSAGGIATYLYSDVFYDKAVTAKVYSVPDSGLFLTDYESPILNVKVIRYMSQALIDLVWGQQRYPLEQCLVEWKNDTVQCFNAANLIKYRKAPMLMLQSAYDEWPIDNLLVARCLSKRGAPFSLQSCNETYLSAINDYRDSVRVSIITMLNIKPNLGVWSPSCVQHGFINDHSFNDANYKVPTAVGKEVQDAIRQFLDNPQKPPIYIDMVNWPDNVGCNGKVKMENLRGKFQFEVLQ